MIITANITQAIRILSRIDVSTNIAPRWRNHESEYRRAAQAAGSPRDSDRISSEGHT
jgi:hypothetical protein